MINASGPPYSGAFFTFDGSLFRVHEANWQASGAYLAVAGQVAGINADLSVDVACAGQGFCRIGEVTDASGKRLKLGEIVKSIRNRLA
ncbi:hypothetical protein D3C72_1864860 [compost metagenome]